MASFRTFIAFDTPAAIRDEITALQRELAGVGADVKWESHDKLHVTVKFIGDLHEQTVPSVGESYVHTGELGALNEFCRVHGLAVIVDEVFLDYTFPEEISAAEAVELRSTGQPIAAVPTFSLAAPSFVGNQDVLTFTLSGLSKISALPQMKVAWVVTTGPAEQVQAAMARLEVIADTYLSMNAPVQWAVPVMLEQRSSIQQQLLGRVRLNLVELDRQIASQKACQRLSAEGGWYAVLRVPVTRSDEELAIELVREKAVLVHPGHFYDFESDGYLVLSLIAPEADFRDGIQRLLEFLSHSGL